MKLVKRDKRITLTLSEECTIAEVESDFDKIRNISDEIKTINVKAGSVKEIDTAYLQLMLSIKQTADERNISISFIDIPDIINNLCSLYGISLFIPSR